MEFDTCGCEQTWQGWRVQQLTLVKIWVVENPLVVSQRTTSAGWLRAGRSLDGASSEAPEDARGGHGPEILGRMAGTQ